MELYVGNFRHTFTDRELNRLFAPFGAIVRARVVTDHFTRQSKCFGYVKMANDIDGSRALQAIDGQTVDTRKIVVRRARHRDDRKGAGW